MRFRTLLASPVIASKRWVYRQYDHMVRTNTLVLPGMGAGVVRVKGTNRALALSVDGNGRYCYLDPYRGAMLAVVEAARNVACAGAEPIGATNCLNFGNPERPEIMWQFGERRRRHHRRVQGARHSDHRRQCQPLQRNRRQGDLSDAGARRRRAHRGREQGARPQLQRQRRRDRSARRDAARAWRQRVSESHCSGFVAGDAARRRPCGREGASAAARRWRARRAAPIGARLCRRRPRGHARGVRVRHGRRRTDGRSCRRSMRRTRGRRPRRCSRNRRRASSCRSRASSVGALLARAKALGVPAREIGTTGTGRISVSINGRPAIDIAVSEAETIWDSAWRSFSSSELHRPKEEAAEDQ